MIIKGKYTVVLKTLMDNEETKAALNKALSNYPMYEPENKKNYSIIPTREQLNQKLLNHYKYREIGFETIGRFLDELEITMNEIMPYYYQLFKSADIMNGIEDPFGNVDIEERFEEETEGSSEGRSEGSANSKTNASSSASNNNSSQTTSNMTNNNKDIKATTPQGLLNIGTRDINSINHANEANWNEALSNSTGTTTDSGSSSDSSESTSESSNSGSSENVMTGKTSHTFTKKGNQGVNTYAHDMKELREVFLNIEKMIIEDENVSELFLRIY